LTEPRVTLRMRECGKNPTFQPRGLIPIRRNQSRKVETIVLKYMITKLRNLEHRVSRILTVCLTLNFLWPMWTKWLLLAPVSVTWNF